MLGHKKERPTITTGKTPSKGATISWSDHLERHEPDKTEEITIKKVAGNDHALTNAIYVNFNLLDFDSQRKYIQIGDKYHPLLNDQTLTHSEFGLNSIQRRENSKHDMAYPDMTLHDTAAMNRIHKTTTFATVYIKKMFIVKDRFGLTPEIERENITKQVMSQLYGLEYLGNKQSYLISLTIGCDVVHCKVQVSCLIYDRYRLFRGDTTKIDVISETDEIIIREQNLFEFQDIREMGVGGLGKEFEEMYRRAFATRALDTRTIQTLDIKHIRGIMLYGPPGCGKTLIARMISKSIGSVKPIIVNGPELLSKFVGQSEENMRMIFGPAEKDYAMHGESSPLHVIIFDEIDSLCKERGTDSGSTGAGDRIVNQLLTKMDGVEGANNFIVIGLTNRLDLIDDALLRPGRFEVKINIGLPDRAGRLEILNIHTDKLRKNSCIDHTVSLEDMADAMNNYTGAEIEGVINSARSYALCRATETDEDDNTTTAVASTKSAASTKSDTLSRINITNTDFMMAMREIRPAFGRVDMMSTLEGGNYGVSYAFPESHDAYSKSLTKLERFKKGYSNFGLFVIAGASGTGRTTVATELAKSTDYPLVRYIDQSKMIGMSDQSKSSYLRSEFKKVKTSKNGVIIIDDIGRAINYTGNDVLGIGKHTVTYNNTILNSISVLIDDLRKSSANSKYLVILTGRAHEFEVMRGDFGSITHTAKLQLLPIGPPDDPRQSLYEHGMYADQNDYVQRLRNLEAEICRCRGVPERHFSLYDLFDTESNRDLIVDIPIKYYIERYTELLGRYGGTDEDADSLSIDSDYGSDEGDSI